MKQTSKQLLLASGAMCFVLALFQVIIGFSPSLSLYFGAPEALVDNYYALISVSILIAAILSLSGLYAISGAGYIRTFPWLKPMLIVISSIYILRGLLLIPELLVVMELLQSPIPVAPRFIFFSIGSLFIGVIFIMGIIGGWNSFSQVGKSTAP